MKSCLSSTIESELITLSMLNNLIFQQLGFNFISNTFRIGFSLVEYISVNLNFYEMNKL